MMIKTEESDFIVSWLKVEEDLKGFDENLVERLFSGQHVSFAGFQQVLAKKFELKASSLEKLCFL